MKSQLRVLGFVALALPILGGTLLGQSRRRPEPQYAQIGLPDQVEGARILTASRDIGFAGAYYLEFEMRVFPRNGDETRIPGRWFGSVNATGPITRVELMPSGAPAEAWLVQSGPRPSIWHAVEGEGLALLGQESGARTLANTNFNAEDLQIPFMYWTDFVYEGLARFRGRPTHVFLLYPPAAQADRFPDVGGARVFVDTAYEKISQAQWVDEDGGALKTITIVDLKRIGEQWIVKSFEARDEATRDKTRFVVRGAALGFPLPDELFSPSAHGGRTEFEVPRTAVTKVK
jgi:hypothetical protein